MKARRRLAGRRPAKPTLFDTLNARTHERIGIRVGNPAVTVHRGFWRPKSSPDHGADYDDGDHRDSDRSDDCWLASIDSYVKEIETSIADYLRESGLPVVLNSLPNPRPEPAKGKSFLLSFDVGPIAVTIMFDLFEEFFSQLVVIDFSSCATSDDGSDADTAREPVLDANLSAIHTALLEVENTIVRRLDESWQRRVNKRPTTRAEKKYGEARMADISRDISLEWDEIKSVFFPDFPAISKADRLFADFFGFSLGIDVAQFLNDPPLKNPSAARLPTKTAASLGDNIRPTQRLKNKQLLMSLADAVWTAATHLNPFYITDRERFDPSQVEVSQRELSFSTINRYRSLYVTSMGGAKPDPEHGVRYPLSYILLSPHRAQWQIGRITDRIHTLGLFRLATLRQFEAIHSTNDRLREIIGKFDAENHDRLPQVEKQYREILREEFRQDGYSYRLQWSQYYRRIFEETARHLQFNRVEGHQTYEEFVRKKLAPKFLLLESASNRLDYAEKLLTSKIQLRNGNSIKHALRTAEVFALPAVLYAVIEIVKVIWNLIGLSSDQHRLSSVPSVWFCNVPELQFTCWSLGAVSLANDARIVAIGALLAASVWWVTRVVSWSTDRPGFGRRRETSTD